MLVVVLSHKPWNGRNNLLLLHNCYPHIPSQPQILAATETPFHPVLGNSTVAPCGCSSPHQSTDHILGGVRSHLTPIFIFPSVYKYVWIILIKKALLSLPSFTSQFSHLNFKSLSGSILLFFIFFFSKKTPKLWHLLCNLLGIILIALLCSVWWQQELLIKPFSQVHVFQIGVLTREI